MRIRTLLVLCTLFFTTTLFAKEVFLSITGKANGFFTDARIFNPSYNKDITVTARYLPAGNGDNSAAPAVQLTIPKRSMKVYDDAVQSIFGGGPPLGAIRLTSDDEFIASQRIYQDARASYQKGTLGQFVPGLEVSTAKRKGILLQLKAGEASLGTFRTNWGGANPNGSVANISFKLYDKNNELAGTNNLTLQPYGVFGPTNIVGFFGNPSNDLSDAWISFESDQPVFLYGSVVDNLSSDPTFIPASEDTGVAPQQPEMKVVTVTAVDFEFNLSGTQNLKANEQVKFIIKSEQGSHGFRLFSPDGVELISVESVTSVGTERTITLPDDGTYIFLCIRPTCGAGHNDMNGSFVVGTAGGPGTGDGY
jgi:heme/copper-type cytochrome/quinol oxidase subunit 2